MDRFVRVDDPTDKALLGLAGGAAFGNTTLPSGFVVPAAPEGWAYYPAGPDHLELRPLTAQHQKNKECYEANL